MIDETLTENLKHKGYEVRVFPTKEEAADYLDQNIDHKTVGIGGSMTIAEMNLADRLRKHNEIYWHQGISDPEEAMNQRRKAALCDVYLSSANGISKSGEIVNIDGNGNRVAAISFGHDKVYFVIGKNKIAENLDQAIFRARNVAAPKNARRFKKKTPCALLEEKCYDCKSPERICKALSVFWEKPGMGEYEVILIDEDLGY